MAQYSLSPFERLANTNPILDTIAFYLAVDPFLGPPVNLRSLLLTSRTVYEHLSVANNSRLYADIFRQKFDYAAVERRLPSGWISAPCLAQELCGRFTALKYIRSGRPSLDSDRDALWKAYLMMLENDGCNAQQLFGWASLPRWTLGAIALRSLPSSTSPGNPPLYLSDPEGMSLATWLLWMTSSKGCVTSEDMKLRTGLINVVLPFLVRGYQQFPSTFAPDLYFYLPICEEDEDVTTGFSGPQPTVSQIRYFGRKLSIAVPPLTSAALLNYTVRREARQDTIPLPPRIGDLPATREDAIARGLRSPVLTQEDVREFHFHTRTRYFGRKHDGLGDTSEQLDKEWFRLVGCQNPWAVERPLRGIVYPLGTLVANWCGRMLVPDVQAHIHAVMDQRIHPTSVPLVQERLSCRFEEHHCLPFNEPLVAPLCPGELSGEDVLNAWLPRDIHFKQRADGLQIFDPSTGKDTWYETYHPDRSLPYSAAACERMRMGLLPEWRSTTSLSATQDTDDGDEYGDFVEERLSGVQDIIITGETSPKQGEAWGYYSYIGRVRQWDGLIVLLRIAVRYLHSCMSDIASYSIVITDQMDNQNRDRGRWIFKGYVHGCSLVGRWRDTATGMGGVGFEGGFVLCKEDEVNATSSDG
ncbi:hypothetical protein HYDPIDRAFT_93726 [Hydnomerulius pinastri MD-312]|uniref:Uncharacterized protein n=1 Tax=Hydnomerulius pinastri MD-312 TaxID=994086 RepID=A0A0C9VB00_9AGAM|nr:hypothetical protein HYDPIDRAFT_93726 [Hydnomerulius pinastri MD-312]